MPVTALPSPYGVGTMGKAAREFIQFLKEAKQTCWQILPLNPTSYGDSPYQSFSSFAGNPYLIDLDDLQAEGLLEQKDYKDLNWGSNPEQVDYGLLYQNRFSVLKKAVEKLPQVYGEQFQTFCTEQVEWLDNYALFMALKDAFGGVAWSEWTEELRCREPQAVEQAQKQYADQITFWKGVQFLFFHQWSALKTLANENGISIIGDVPIYVALDSADVWANPQEFQLDENRNPTEVAGCPPDGFSADGQLWGNPLFQWDKMKEDGYRWWMKRIEFQFTICDILRIDHFRGFDAYYAIPAGAKNAKQGRWREGPGIDFFRTLEETLGKRPIIAEDLGFLTPSVYQLLEDTGYPGMKVLEFAFDSRDGGGATYQPHNYPRNCIAYVGTHDNDTVQGWLNTADPGDVALAREYLCLQKGEEHWGMMRGIWSSVADCAIVQMQDLLGLGSEARINTPSTLGGNWVWRMKEGSLTHELAHKIARQMELYGRTKPKPKKGEQDMTNLKEALDEALKAQGCSWEDCTKEQVMTALLVAIRQQQKDMAPAKGKKKLYYFSAEFLIGRLLRANLMNLGCLKEVEGILAEHGYTFTEIEECEKEPSLGNGGLGRLAACFLDSIASLGLPGDGVGLNYHYGLFHQNLSTGAQQEEADPWIEPESWLLDTGISFPVPFANGMMMAKLFDLEVPGYENGVCNRLHLFDVEQPAPAPEQGIDFDKTDIAHHLTSFLYPDDSDENGRLLRVYQQYFMVCAGAQLILKELQDAGHSLQELDQYVMIQINDTHPSMVIPELIRQLMERGVDLERAIYLVERSCAYTNHTILAEALEKWSVSYLEKVAPQLLPVIQELDKRAKLRSSDPKTAIWDENNLIHMAHMDIHYSSSVNGVAALHTEILKDSELNAFYKLYPQKFNNKTNGITFRRWLMGCNEPLSNLITQTIGEEWKKNPDCLKDLEAHKEELLPKLLEVKAQSKQNLANWLKEKQGITVDENSIFDIQIKRLHQYKRQQMNALYAIWKYFQIKEGNLPQRPITLIFGAKAAPAYTLAKDTIHLLLCLSKLIDRDPEVSKWLKLVMVENYNVSAAQMLIPACDISEQISLASKEASGTGNMKFMANGAVTLGTLDGANVEISQLVGEENIYLFGKHSDEVIALYANNGYHSSDYWQNPEIGKLVDFILSPELMELGNLDSLLRLYKDFIAKDYFMTLLDLEDYIKVKEQCLADYENREAWAEKMLVNVARSGFFSSDRTIREYNNDIWHLSTFS